MSYLKVTRIESRQVRGSGRMYFLDIEQARNQQPYLKITQSRLITASKPKRKERTSIYVFAEDAEALGKAVRDPLTRLPHPEKTEPKT